MNYANILFYIFEVIMDNSSSNVILVTGSYDQTLIFWNALEGNSLYHIDYPEKVNRST